MTQSRLLRVLVVAMSVTTCAPESSGPIDVADLPAVDEALVLRHIDLYRLTDPGELQEIGLEAPESHEVWLVEWPERAALQPDLEITLTQGPTPDARRADLVAGPRWQARLRSLLDG